MNKSGNDWRRITEARQWIRWGYTTPATVADLHRRIKARRGESAANQLRQDMREQYITRQKGEWE